MTNAEAQFNKSLCPWKPEGSLGRTAQDVHLDSHTAPELWTSHQPHRFTVMSHQVEKQVTRSLVNKKLSWSSAHNTNSSNYNQAKTKTKKHTHTKKKKRKKEQEAPKRVHNWYISVFTFHLFITEKRASRLIPHDVLWHLVRECSGGQYVKTLGKQKCTTFSEMFSIVISL